MKSHSKPQQAALTLARARLDPSHELFAASPHVAAHLHEIRAYLHTWVLPLLDYMLEGQQWHNQADDIRDQWEARKASALLAKRLREAGQ